MVWIFVIETKGRSLEEVDKMYVARIRARGSSGWKTGEKGTGLGSQKAEQVTEGRKASVSGTVEG